MRMLPLRDYSEHEVINGFFSTVEGVIDGGTFVKIDSFDPTKEPVEYVQTTYLSKQFARTLNPFWFVPNKVTVADSGAYAHDVLGVTLFDVKAVDENGQKLLYDPVKKDELNVLLTGEAMPVLRRGFIQINDQAFKGIPGPHKLGVVAEDGKVEAFTWAELTGAGFTTDHVVGRFLSTTGDNGGYNRREGGYCFFSVEL